MRKSITIGNHTFSKKADAVAFIQKILHFFLERCSSYGLV